MKEIIESAIRKTNQNPFLPAILSGIFIALGAYGSIMAGTLGDYGKIIGACVFPIGLIMTVFCGAELFTGNNLILISVLDKKVNFFQMIKNLILVYIGNGIGSFIIALLTFNSLPNTTAAITKTSLSISDMILKGILCNILVCVAVYMAGKAKSDIGKILLLFLPVCLFVLCGFEHCVANMYFIPVGMLAGADVSIGSYFTNLVFVTNGNIIGGFGLSTIIWLYKKNNR